ncbi:MAG: ABC transporter substrate-binding protein [Thermodesulfobacteriota bacterium]|jgi:peptide/nickel transport system substrate-binding protein
MNEKKKLLRIFSGLVFLMFLIAVIPAFGAAAPAEKPVTAKEWAEKYGLDWGPKYWPTKPVQGGIYQLSNPLYIGLMNPNHWPVNDWVTISYFYDKLIWTGTAYKPYVPFLAESWKYLDPKTVTMKLRQGVQFHDGTPFNAESVKYQMEWIKDPANGAWSRAWLEPLHSVEVVDNYTVKWHFNKPWAAFVGVMANVPGYMISTKALKADVALREVKKLAGQVEREKKNVADAEKEVATAAGEAAEKAKAKLEAAKKKLAPIEEQYKKAAALAEGAKPLDNFPVGTGSMMFEEGSPGNYLRIKRNPNWWFGRFIGRPDMPYFDGINVSIIPDPSVRLANLRAGKLDSMAIDPSQYPMVKNDRSLNVYVYPLNWVVGMRFNTKDGPCKDIRVRKAISHALDRKALINGVAFGLGDPASGPFPYEHWAHNPNLKPVAYNPELSKKLLAEAGYKNGLTIRGYMYNESAAQTGAEAMKNMLAKVGITWKVELLDPAAASEKMRKLDYDLATNTWTWIYDPDLLVTGWYDPDGGFNFGKSNNKKAIDLIEAGREEVNEAKRTKIYWELEKVLYDSYEDVYLYYPKAVTLFRKNVQGWNNDIYQKLIDIQWWTHPLWFKGGKR